MKVSLVVAQGVHAGKVIPIATTQFLIGRDPQCNLRPASPSISKQHCGIFTLDGKVVVKDYGSTNGTSVNGEAITGEREVLNDDNLKVGPLEFVVRIEVQAPTSTVVVAPAKAKSSAGAAKALTPSTAPATPPTPVAASSAETAEEHSEQAAAMFLAMDDGSDVPTEEAKVPDGSTVMDIPAMPGGPSEAKPPAKPAAPANSSKAAADILSKYMRRPRT